MDHPTPRPAGPDLSGAEPPPTERLPAIPPRPAVRRPPCGQAPWARPGAAPPGAPVRGWIWGLGGPRLGTIPAPDAGIAHVYICTVCDYIQGAPRNSRSPESE